MAIEALIYWCGGISFVEKTGDPARASGGSRKWTGDTGIALIPSLERLIAPATHGGQILHCDPPISIHASAKDATCWRRSRWGKTPHFNPRIREGCDERPSIKLPKLLIFQSTPPLRGAWIEIQQYDKTKIHFNGVFYTKIDRVCDSAAMLPLPPHGGFVLVDSWFTCSREIDSYAAAGHHLIGGLKTNRIHYPQGIRISVLGFAQHIRKKDVRLVTVKGSPY